MYILYLCLQSYHISHACRFTVEYNKLADKYWPKNIVIVSHGYGVCQAVAMVRGEEYCRDVWVDYCGFVEMSRTSTDSHSWTEESRLDIHDD